MRIDTTQAFSTTQDGEKTQDVEQSQDDGIHQGGDEEDQEKADD
jgi:hypothetical protein